MKILFTAGTFDNNGGRASGLMTKLNEELSKNADLDITFINGGYYECLKKIILMATDYDVVFWMANVPNELDKVRNVKEINPKVLLVNSKRNDGRYSAQELINRALGQKANLSIEFNRGENGIFNMRLFDPLGVAWYEGESVAELATALNNRLSFLITIHRQGTIQSEQTGFSPAALPDIIAFVDLVRNYAEVFHDVIQPAADVKRFLGNASMRNQNTLMQHQSALMQNQSTLMQNNFRCTKDDNFKCAKENDVKCTKTNDFGYTKENNFRCTKGFPSFKMGDLIYVSRRNVNKEELSINDFVPVYFDGDEIKYAGPNKPSVDTPIQLRLYQRLPNINYMIHSHCYVNDAPFTKVSIPCGGLEEVDEVIETLLRNYDSLDQDFYAVNLIGHGNIIMGKTVRHLQNIKFYGRPIFERM